MSHKAEALKQAMESLQNRVDRVLQDGNEVHPLEIEIVLEKIRALYDIMIDYKLPNTNSRPAPQAIESPKVEAEVVREEPKAKAATPKAPKPFAETPKPAPVVEEKVVTPEPPKAVAEAAPVEEPKAVAEKPAPVLEEPAPEVVQEVVPEPQAEAPAKPAQTDIFAEPAVAAPAAEVKQVEEKPAIQQALEAEEKTNGETQTVADKFSNDTKSLYDKLSQQNEGESVASRLQQNTAIADIKAGIGLNEKFRMLNDLFHGNNNDYQASIDKLNTCENLEEALQFFNRLSQEFHWDAETDIYAKLISLVNRRYLVTA